MADKILHKRNLSIGNVPTSASLDPGELAINVADGKLFLRQSGSIENKIITVGESSSFAATASFVTASNVYGPYGSNSIISASYALQALSSSYANFATSASHTLFAETASNSLNTQDILIYVLNNSGYNIPKGTVVHITASGNSSDTPRIISASYENDANSANTLGIANESIANGANGYVMTEGVLKGIDTSAFISGQMIYLGATGSIIGSAPQAPLHGVRLGQVVRVQQNNGSVYVRIDNGYELDELHDVRIMTASLQYGDLLMRSGSVWTNSKQLSGSYNMAGTLSATHVTASDLYAGATYISGSLTVVGQSTFYGTASFVNVTASNLFVSESFISVNVFEPIERFGGLKVYDSGSSTATASLAWDSLHNHWVYQNVDGLTYTGGMLLSGPRNTGSLGDEPNLTKWFVPRSDGGDHLDNSQIFTSGSVTQITGSLTVTSGVTASLLGNASTSTSASFASTASFVATAQTASYVLQAVSASFATSASHAELAKDAYGINSSITNNINNNILTATGTGVINGESNLTFNGNTLIISGEVARFNHAAGTDGINTGTFNSYTHAQGYRITAFGSYSHAEGSDTAAYGTGSHAEGSGSATRTNRVYGVKLNNITSGVFTLTGDVTAVFAPGNRLYYDSVAYPDNTSFVVDTSVFGGVSTTITLTNTSITDSNFVVGSLDYSYNSWAGNQQSVADGGHAEGWYTNAVADWSHTEGFSTQTFGRYAHAEGDRTQANGQSSHAEGRSSKTFGQFSHAEGFTTQANGIASHAEGYQTQASGSYSHAEGRGAIAYADWSHAEGESTQTFGYASHAEGESTTANGNYSHAEGNGTTASGTYSHAEGEGTQANGIASHTEGFYTTASGTYSHAEGAFTFTGQQNGYLATMPVSGIVTLDTSYGDQTGLFNVGSTIAIDDYAYASNYGYLQILIQSASWDGTNTILYLLDNTVNTPTASVASITQYYTNAGDQYWGGSFAHAEGNSAQAYGSYSHAEGSGVTLGSYSHAKSNGITYGDNSHAEGGGITYGDNSHAEGNGITYGDRSHAEGEQAKAGYLGYNITGITSGVIELDPKYGDLTGGGWFSPGGFVLIADTQQEISSPSTTHLKEIASVTYNGTPATEITLVDTSINTSNKNYVGIYTTPLPLLADVLLGGSSHAEGFETQTLGEYSHAEGRGTEALGWHQSVVGQYNTPISNTSAFIVGDGVDVNTRHNLLVAAAGNVTISGSLLMSGSIIPNVDGVSVTSSFSLGSATNAWKDIWVANSSIYMLDTTGSIQTTITSNASGVSITGSLQGTASFASTASYVLNAVSSSYAPSTILYNSTSPVSVTGTTSETLIASVPIPTNINNTILRASFIVVVTTLGAAAPRVRMRIGTIETPTSVQLSSQTQLGTNGVGSANSVSMYRTMPVVGGSSGNIKVISAASNIISDYASSTTYDTISVDWTTQRYIYFTITNNTIAAVTQCYGVLLEQLKQ